MPKRCPSADSNQDSDRSEVRHSKLSQLELKVRGVPSTPSRGASMDHTETASKEGMQDSRCFDSPQVHVEEVVSSPYRTMIE